MLTMISFKIGHYVHMLITEVVGYKIQDKFGNREICKDHITSDCFLDSLGKPCNICNCELTCTIHANGAAISSITDDRMRNHIPHSLNSCNIRCVSCTTSNSNFNNFVKREIKHVNVYFVDGTFDFVCTDIISYLDIYS